MKIIQNSLAWISPWWKYTHRHVCNFVYNRIPNHIQLYFFLFRARLCLHSATYEAKKEMWAFWPNRKRNRTLQKAKQSCSIVARSLEEGHVVEVSKEGRLVAERAQREAGLRRVWGIVWTVHLMRSSPRMHARTYGVRSHTGLHMYTNRQTDRHTYTHTCTHARMQAHTYTDTHTQTYTRTYTH